jgi:hypothetical protein
MKKLLALAAAMLLVLPVLAMAGMTAFDNMTELGDEMAEVTGQVGITIDSSLDLTIGYLAWTDADGYGSTLGTGGTGGAGCLRLDTITVNDGAGGALDMTGMTIDAGSNAAGVGYLVIKQPSIEGTVTVGNIYLGTGIADTYDETMSLGSVTISGLTVGTSIVKISAHD